VANNSVKPAARTANNAVPLYYMSLSLNVLNHLGLNLYSNNPAVLSEIVANAWDADAESVQITLDSHTPSIIIQDDGTGMTLEEINGRFLHVGYQRRVDKSTQTSPSGRKVMGRKGIGKLSLFSIARVVQIETAKSGQKHKLSMNLDDIEAAIKGVDPSSPGQYSPVPMPTDSIDFTNGTRITLTSLKRDLSRTAPHLRRRLARRFSVLSKNNKTAGKSRFAVFIGGVEVEPSDAEQLTLAQYLWTFGTEDDHTHYQGLALKADKKIRRQEQAVDGIPIRGWIGTAFNAGNLRENDSQDDLNKVSLMIRGKLAQENLLDEFNENGIYRSYLVGEIHADFLDEDDKEDIATSSRQKIREDDPRYQELLTILKTELSNVQAKWTDFRNEDGTKKALENPRIQEWFDTLTGDTKKKAKSLFGRINQLTVDDDDRRGQLFAHSVLAFETMRHKDNLDALGEIATEDLGALAQIFTDATDLEAALYHKIVSGRLAVIQKLQDLVDDDAKEKFLQDHLFTHLWLLDPGWERASDRHMELAMKTAFQEIEAKLDPDEKNSRFDIRYKRTSGIHVIVELKRAGVKTTTDALSQQIRKYRKALQTSLLDADKTHEGISIICVVGRDLKDWADHDGRVESAKQLLVLNTRVVKYEELLSNARGAYEEYLTDEEHLGRIQRVLAGLDEGLITASPAPASSSKANVKSTATVSNDANS
jgi:hypothetical protein